MKYEKMGYSAPKGLSGEMGHDKAPKPCNVLEAQKKDMGKIDKKPIGNLGYPSKAWEYKY